MKSDNSDNFFVAGKALDSFNKPVLSKCMVRTLFCELFKFIKGCFCKDSVAKLPRWNYKFKKPNPVIVSCAAAGRTAFGPEKPWMLFSCKGTNFFCQVPRGVVIFNAFLAEPPD